MEKKINKWPIYIRSINFLVYLSLSLWFSPFLLAYSTESDDSCHSHYIQDIFIYMKNIISLGYLSFLWISVFLIFVFSYFYQEKQHISWSFLSYCPNLHYSALLPKIFFFPLTMPQYLVWRIFELSPHSLYEDWSK